MPNLKFFSLLIALALWNAPATAGRVLVVDQSQYIAFDIQQNTEIYSGDFPTLQNSPQLRYEYFSKSPLGNDVYALNTANNLIARLDLTTGQITGTLTLDAPSGAPAKGLAVLRYLGEDILLINKGGHLVWGTFTAGRLGSVNLNLILRESTWSPAPVRHAQSFIFSIIVNRDLRGRMAVANYNLLTGEIFYSPIEMGLESYYPPQYAVSGPTSQGGSALVSPMRLLDRVGEEGEVLGLYTYFPQWRSGVWISLGVEELAHSMVMHHGVAVVSSKKDVWVYQPETLTPLHFDISAAAYGVSKIEMQGTSLWGADARGLIRVTDGQHYEAISTQFSAIQKIRRAPAAARTVYVTGPIGFRGPLGVTQVQCLNYNCSSQRLRELQSPTRNGYGQDLFLF